MKKRTFKLFLCLQLSFLLFSQTSMIAQVMEMSDQDLTNASTAVLYGKCSAIECSWNENRSIIYTYVTVIPQEYLKGNLGPVAKIAVPGGKVGDIIYEVSDMPVFVEGEEIVVFVRTNKAGKNLLTGGYKGKMKIDTDKKTGKKSVFETVSAKDSGVSGMESKKPEKVKLEDFVAKVKGYAKN